ncbi:MAG: type II toxin-antitoxin system VapC family toxin [Vicinamibacterales bacterium]
MRTWLVDTGPLVAYIDRADPMHEAVARTLEPFSGRLLTTGPVITESMHLLADAVEGPMLLAEFIVAASLDIVEAMRPPAIRQAAVLMRKYADTPMDFADATLVQLADATGVLDILTLDRRGFSTYRTSAGKRFRLM